jgi:hypothetical protein
LTNTSINSENYNSLGEQNKYKLSLKQLRKIYKDSNLDFDKVLRKIKKIVILTMISVEKKMLNRFHSTYKTRNSFYELYGFDVLITNKMRPYLIEVN